MQNADALTPNSARARRSGARPIVQPAALHEQVRDRLRAMIVRGTLPAGSNIGETELSDRLGISRTPLREALKLLGAEGLIELRSRRGAFVVPINLADVADAFEVAAGLEQLGAAQAALRATGDDIAQLERWQQRMEARHAARELDAYFDLNQSIHRGIVAMSGNATLRCTHELLFPRIERLRFAALRSNARWDESIAEHRAVLAAIAARDPAAAGAAMAHHVRRTGTMAEAALAAGAARP